MRLSIANYVITEWIYDEDIYIQIHTYVGIYSIIWACLPCFLACCSPWRPDEQSTYRYKKNNKKKKKKKKKK